MTCSFCGHWNCEGEHRCAHCGRRSEGGSAGSLSGSGLNTGKLREEILASVQGDSAPTAAAPAWKREVEEKVGAYLERRRAGQREGASEVSRGLASESEPPLLIDLKEAASDRGPNSGTRPRTPPDKAESQAPPAIPTRNTYLVRFGAASKRDECNGGPIVCFGRQLVRTAR